MKLNQVLVITAIPALLGTLVFSSINKADAANTSFQTIARNEQPKPPAPKPERPEPKPERPEPKPERPAPKGNFKAAVKPASLTVAQNRPPQGQGRRQKPDLAAAASKLGISEEQLKEALGVPENPPERPE